MSGAVVVSAEAVRVSYGSVTALDGVGLEVSRGSVYALLGRNGAGKSTLVRCLLGQQRPQAGTCRILGEDAWRRRARIMARVGVAPETPDVPAEMTVLQASHFLARLYPRWDDAGVRARLERFGVPQTTAFGRLSKGERAQASVSLALGHAPELLVLDDPTLGLDAVARRELMGELIGELADRGTTVLLTSHDIAGVEAIADRVGILRDGRLVVDEPIEDLKARFRRFSGQRGVEVAARSAAVVSRVAGLGGEVVVADWGSNRPLQDGAAGDGLSLEDIFLAVAGEDAERSTR